MNFLRWLFASLVVFDHAWPLGDLGDGMDPMWRWSHGQDSFGGIAVAGFFIISGFLITRSWFSSGSLPRFLWHRVLRIFPGFWVCLIVTAFVFAPVVAIHQYGSFTSVFSSKSDTPFSYVWTNLGLHMGQYPISGLLQNTPWGRTSTIGAWDGSLWTLIYEFHCYLGLALIGWVGLLRGRTTVVILTAICYAFMLSWRVDPAFEGQVLPLLSDVYIARFGFLFGIGSVFALCADRIPIDDRIGVACLALALWALLDQGWLAVGYPAFAYVLVWTAVRLPVRNWARYGDFSYGIYIWAFPLQMMFAEAKLQHAGPVVFIIVSLASAHVAAFFSWHLVERQALRLKGWSPPLLRHWPAGRTREVDLPLPLQE